jgi:hypothetical protein
MLLLLSVPPPTTGIVHFLLAGRYLSLGTVPSERLVT